MKKNIITTSLVILVLAGLFSCESMDELHYQFIKDGEVRYTTKMDSVKTYAGDSRVLITGILQEARGVEFIKVFYNDNQDSVVVDYERQSDLDSIEIMIDNLDEKSYSFNIYTGNSLGDRSIRVPAFGTAYGELYRKGLLSRIANSFEIRGTSNIAIDWLNSDELERGTDLVYADREGNTETVFVHQDSSETVMLNFGEGIQFRSWYVPEPTALDSFVCEWNELEIGIYESEGVFVHPITGERAFGHLKILERTGLTVYETEFADLASYDYRMKLKINEDNTVEVISSGSAPPCEPDGESTYDPVTETFTLSYKYNTTTGYRFITETIAKR
ncbi:MAG: DUF4998 domain-containing protein [Bacteroidales bacterium]|nr:DUF4998 domain-containing protein [Bacteroidales bacterium]MDT8430430.1 DUF4998 domain-containing protein [Bacteroidales bacterium]